MNEKMSLRLYYHPLASFCWKALIAFYENGVAFEPVIVDLSDERSSAAFRAVWPMAKMPVLRDEARDRTIAEATIIVEYLDAHCPGPTRLVPVDTEGAWQARMWDRFHDHYVQEPMQKIVTDRLRPKGASDSFGVEQARAQLTDAYRVLEGQMRSKTWAIGEAFTLADCAAAPALFYANTVVPFDDQQRTLRAYLDRLMTRPSFARVLKEAEPYFRLFPMEQKPQIRLLGTADR
jgi:glutathione S-transferase